jgi:GH24 family phage-related lysozyme (muramidase)
MRSMAVFESPPPKKNTATTCFVTYNCGIRSLVPSHLPRLIVTSSSSSYYSSFWCETTNLRHETEQYALAN